MIKANIINVDYFNVNEIYLPFECEIHFTRFGKCNRLHNNINPILFENDKSYKVFVSCNEPSSSPNREPPHRIIYAANQYNLILTTDEEVLNNVKNSVLFPYGTTWLNKSKSGHSDSLGTFDENLLNDVSVKEFNISFMTTNHFGSPGYEMRRIIWNNRNLIKNKTKFYSSTRFPTNQPTWNNLIFSNTLHDGLLPNDDKINLFKSQFSIVVENNKEKWYFTEKLIDSLLCKTIPVYWGCSDLSNFFDVRGIITFNTPQEFFEKINLINEETYDKMSPYIENNFKIAKKYGKSIFERVKNEIISYRNKNASI
jgi:hypothetical protein